jgi:hypothetical protein
MIERKFTQEVIIVGDDFTPNAQGDSEIDSLLGYSTCLLEDQAIRSEKYGCVLAPNYSDDIEVTLAELEKLGIDPLISTIRPSQKKKLKSNNPNTSLFFTASFIFNDECCLTVPFESEAQALSCVLWYALAYH